MNKIISAGAILAITIAGIAIYRLSSETLPSEEPGKKMDIVASFYPMAFFAGQIAGDKGTVTNITAEGVEPHEYELTSQDLVRLEQADLVVANGIVEPWVEDIQKNLGNSNTRIIIAGEELTKNNDPHVWLSPALVQQQVIKIAQAITQTDPENSTYYEQNLQTLLEKLSNVNASYKTGLSQCASRTIVTSHDAFGYLAEAYGLHQITLAGLSPEEEPSPKALADVTKFVRKNNVKYIFFETLVSPALSETIAHETGASTLELNPLEGLSADDVQQKKDYFSVMQSNLQNLQTALGCTT